MMGGYAQSCLTLCDPMDCKSSSVHGVFQARILEWVAISFSRDLPNPEIEPASFVFPVLVGRFFPTAPPGNSPFVVVPRIFSCSLRDLVP